MKQANNMFYQTRRRFLGMLGTVGTMLLPWPVSGRSRSTLSRHEASYYHKRRRHGS